MSRLNYTAAADELPAEDSGNLCSGSGSKPEVNRVGSLEAKKDQGSSAAAAVVNKGRELSLLMNGVGSSSGDGKRGLERRMMDLNAVNVEGMGTGRWNGESYEEQGHGFRAGDLVWGKVKGHPWWPGMVLDPRDASEFAWRHSQEGRVLVAFFGDGSCSWCLPLQLVPFSENLDRMWGEMSSRSFEKAVHRALDEFGRRVESRMLRRCIPVEKMGHLARPVVENIGVKAGVLVPEVDIDRLPIPEYEPADIRAKLVGLARTASFESLFELAMLRSWISAYYYAEFGRRLAVYSEPTVIPGLEDNEDRKSLAVERPIADKIYFRRKKNVSEIMAKEEAGNGGLSDEDLVVKQPTEIEATMGSSTRERKKSKYLSPPYTNLNGRGYNLKFDDLWEIDTMKKDNKDQQSSVLLEELDDKVSANEKATSLASDVDLDVNELLLKLASAAVDRFYLRNEGHLDSISAFVSAYKSSTYLRGSLYQKHHKCNKVSHKRKKPFLASLPRGSSPKVSLAPTDEPTDDLVSDARVIRQKVDSMTEILESCGSKFSPDDKSRLKEEMKRLKEKVVRAGDKVRLMAEKSSS